MYAEDLSSNNGSYRKRVESINEGLPNLDIAAAFAFIVETVDYRNKDRLASVLQKYKLGETIPLVTLAHSWFPRRRKKFSGYFSL